MFTYAAYESLIDAIFKSGYTFTTYHEYKNVERPCILRHDVDISLKKAAEFAEKEKAISDKGYGNCSIYFVMLSGSFYNVFSKDSLRAIDKITSLGNEIGLHFDETKYNTEYDFSAFAGFVHEEITLLARITGLEIKAVSMHKPSQHFLDSNLMIPNIINSYSFEFFKEFKYMSDSSMHWREDVFSIIRSRQFDNLHILTHPIWYDEQEMTYKNKLISMINGSKYEYYMALSDNVNNLQEVVGLEDWLRSKVSEFTT